MSTSPASREYELAARFLALPKERRRRLFAGLQAQGIALAVLPVPLAPAGPERERLSYAQERLWFLAQLDPDSVAYNMAGALRLRGVPDASALERAIGAIVQRHEALRTTFETHAGVARAVVHAELTLPLVQVDARAEFARDGELCVRAWAEREAQVVFELSRGPLLRVALVRFAADDYGLFVCMHHVVSDGWSLRLFIAEFAQHYDAFVNGAAPELPPVAVQYADYATWQRSWLEAGELERQLAYWREQLAGEQRVLRLPTDRPRPDVQSQRGAVHAFSWPAPLVRDMRRLAQAQGVTLFMLGLAAFDALLHRVTGETDLWIGSSIANRNRLETEASIGFFVNTQVLRTTVLPEQTFAQLLAAVKHVALAAQTHQDLPFEQLVEALAPERSLAHNPLFQVHYDHQSRAYDTLRSLAGLRITDIAREQSSTMFDLMLTTLEQPDGTISAGFGYATDLFERATVERLAQRLTRLLELAVSAPDTQVAQLVWLEPHEHVAQGHLPLRAADDATGGRAIAAPQPRAYAAPSSAVERQLSAIWCEVLQLPDVSLDDNFFELGGDSIISIQVVSRARERGLVLRPKDLFQHQTLRRLAAVVTLASGAVSLAAASGDYPLTPIQIAFFARALPEPQHFNQAVLLECKPPLVNKTLERALAAVIAQHEALVMSFRQREVGSAWRQYSGNDATHVLTTAHVGDRAEIRERCEAAQRSLNLERGELLRALHLRLPDGSSLLLLVVHHLVVDGVSWRVLLEDLQRAYTNPELALPPRTSAFGHWAERLHEYAESPALAAEFEYWQRTAARIRPLPVDHVEQATPLTIADVERVAVRLNHVETEQLLKHSAAAYRTHIQELLLAALTRALCETFGQSEVSVLLEGHGREDVFDGVDVSRTVGWFTSEYPVVLASAVELSDTIKQVKEQLRNVPQRGLGYGVLATLGSADQRQQLTAAHAPSIAFNYLGQFDATFGEDALFRAASENAGSDAAASTPLAHALEINGQVYAGELTLWIGFSPRQYERATVQRLAELFEQALRAVITHNTTPGVGSVTPSDYPLARLDQHELDALVVEARPADLYPVTAMQHGLLFHALYDSEPGIYVTQLAVTIAGLDTARFVAAWRRALERHTILRTSFVWDLQREPLQFVHEKAELAYEFCDLRGVPDQAEQLHTFVREQHRRGFALGRAPLWRVALVQLDERRQHFVWTHHHLLLDGWSTARLLDEVLLDYLGRDAREPSHAFADYVAWLSRRDLPASETFWRERLRQLEEPTLLAGYLPAADSGEARKTTGVQMVRSLLSEAETSALTALAQQQHVTVSALVQAAWALILQRYTGQTSVVFGATTSGRPPELPGSESMLGLFINTLPVIVNAQPTAALGEFWQTLQQAGSAAREHEHTPLASLQRWAGTSELFDTLIVFENFPIDNALRADWQELAFGPVETLEITNYALTLAVHPGAQLALGLAFDPAQLAQSGVQLIAAQMSALLRSFVRESPRMPTGQLALFGEPAQQSAAATTPATPLHALILGRMLARGSQEQAVVSGGGEAWTAALLEQRVLTLTARLRARGVTRESLVGLYVQRGPWLVAGALAVWRAGAAYVPLDPAYPRERLAWMVADAGLALVLSTHGYPELNVDTLWIADEADAAVSAPLTAAVDVRPEQLAYVIYTSGSTGTPKGVAVAHGALNMHAHAIAEQYHMTEDDCALHMASASFDAAVEQWTTPLLSGARLFFCDEQPWTAAETLALLRRERVTVVYPPTSQLIALCQYLEQSREEYKLRICCVGGEAVSRESVALIRRSVRPELIINGYGPTETVVTPMAWRATPELACATPYAPIGWVIGDRSAYVLDAELNLLPRGVAGELYLGGTGMARGYLGRPQLTAASFVPDPFSATPGARLYRTGDRVRALPDGVIEFLGRVDHQVKLRGYRIELGEIEARLLAQREVGEAVVVVRNDSGRPQLVAYVSCNDVEATQLTAAIAQRLRAELPAHMVPAHIVALTQLPHTPNGKIDRRALPAPLHIVGERTPARNELESALCAAFADVLGTHELGVHDDFFELGGDSLSSLQLVSRLRAHGHTLSLREVFELRNVAALAAVLSARVQVASAQPQIERVTREPVHALSHAQERLWFLAQLEPDSAAYNISGGLRLRGSLDYTRLQQSFQSLVTRHEALRTSFEERDGRGMQRIHAHAQVVLQLLAARGPDSEQRARELFAAELLQPFDLAQAPLLRVVLIQLADEDHVLAVSLHHMVADGWSMRLLIEEFAQAYANGASLPEPSLQYLDYASWQRNWLGAGELTRQLAYWREQLGDEHPVLELPLDHPRPAAPTRRGGAFVFTLDARTSAGVVQLAHACNASVFMVLLAAFESVLYRMTGQRDLRVGVPVSNRNRLDTESVVGLFVNTLVLRTQLDGALAFADLVARVRETSLAAQSHQDLPFELLVEDLAPERSLAHNPLFQVLFDHQRSGLSALHSLSGLTAEPYAIESRPAKFDLSLEMIEDEGVISGNFAYASELFEPASIEALAQRFQRVLSAVVQTPTLQLADLPLLAADERAWLSSMSLPASAVVHPRELVPDEFVQARISEQARLQPDAQALLGEAGAAWTYAQLERASNQWAHRLLELGVGPEAKVGLCVGRSPRMVVAALAILKAGCAYVPLDPKFPLERQRAVLLDAGVHWVLTESLQPRAAENCVYLELDREDVSAYPVLAPTIALHGENLAYVVYTSGSTGRPKGVGVSHAGLARQVQAIGQDYGMRADDCALHFFSFSFDASVEQWVCPLVHGARLFIRGDELWSADRAVDVLREQGVTWFQMSPGYLREVAAAVLARGETLSLRSCSVGGEAVSRESLALMLRAVHPAPLINGYGPTETVMAPMSWHVTDVSQCTTAYAPIGRVVGARRGYVLDADLNVVPRGVTGELYLGGFGVARGYMGRPDLTAERFVPDPFAPLQAGDRMYRTGDLARVLADGSVEYAGRADHQVKVRGFRVELGEVEGQLLAQPGVREAVVVAQGGAVATRLIGYVSGDVSVERLLPQLRAALPEYMVPAQLVVLAELPRNSNGKIDRKLLPEPEAAAQVYEAPQTELEAQLCAICSAVLGVETIGRSDNFFELGGDSIRSLQVISRARKLGFSLSPRDMFECRSIAELASRAVPTEVAPELTQLPRESELYRLSYAQERLWFLAQLDPESAAYHVPGAVRLRGALDVVALQRALNELVARHEALRTTFELRGGEPRQRVHATLPVQLHTLDLRAQPLALAERAARTHTETEAQAAFDLQRGPLLRVSIVHLSDHDHVLVLVAHHIVSDAWSLELAIAELSERYLAAVNGEQLQVAALPVQYIDYADWQRRWLSGPQLARQLAYWQAELGTDNPVLELPFDHARPAQQTFRGAVRRSTLDPELGAQLHALARAQGVTPFMLLLAAWQTLLYRVTGQRAVRVGVPITNRSRIETERLIGLFVNTQVLASHISGELRFAELLQAVKQSTLGASAHRELPFEQLVEALQPERSLGHNPLFQVAYNHASASPIARVTALDLHEFEWQAQGTQFDLSLDTEELSEQRFGMAFTYATDLFEPETIALLAARFERLLRQVVAKPTLQIADIALLDEQEQLKLMAAAGPRVGASVLQTAFVHEGITAQAELRPNAIALQAETGPAYTYAQLERASNQWAQRLRQYGVGPEVKVGLCVSRSARMVLAALAISKAGGAYVSLDPNYPTERLRAVVAAAQVQLILSEHAQPMAAELGAERCVWLDSEDVSSEPAQAPNVALSGDNLAYVVYTSGSTGRPKGVGVSHAALMQQLVAIGTDYGMTPDDCALHFASLSFDAGVEQWASPLLFGARLFMRGDELWSAERALSILREQRVSWFDMPPGYVREIAQAALDRGERLSVRACSASAEALSRESLALILRAISPAPLINGYGPTEAVITPMTWHVRDVAACTTPYAPIGRVVGPRRGYVLDADLNVVPDGVVGELYLAGTALARGYLGQPALTAERFVSDPFATERGARMYRTGDLARRHADGNVEFLGRADQQVKVRGFRVELGEIESQLLAQPGVHEAVVIAQGGAVAQRLIAYVAGEPVLESAGLLAQLRAALPEYLVPALIVKLAALPRNSNGKVDRKRLPEPTLEAHAYVAPRTALETSLCEIWQSVLGVERVGVTDNFFALGGHSLLVMRVVTRVRAELGVDVAVRQLFETRDLAELAVAIARVSQSTLAVDAAVAGALNELEGMSDDDLAKLLDEVEE